MNIKQQVLDMLDTLPEIDSWPMLRTVMSKGGSSDWEIPLYVARAMGTPADLAVPAAAAIACQYISIILVDDMLDNDPRGEYHRLGVGRTANIALALQAGGSRLIAKSHLSGNAQAIAQNEYALTGIRTAYGQNLDADNLRGESNYWNVVENKSTPFYAGAFGLGCVFAGGNREQVKAFHEFGKSIGIMVQVCDDIEDALSTEINADWTEARNNLLFMYAETATHDQRDEFIHLQKNITAEGAHKRAQQILVECGALSYAVYLVMLKYHEGIELIDNLKLKDKEPLISTLEPYKEIIMEVVGAAGLDTSAILG